MSLPWFVLVTATCFVGRTIPMTPSKWLTGDRMIGRVKTSRCRLNQPEHSCFKISGSTYFYEWWSRMSAASKCTFTSGTRSRNRSAGESFMALGVNLVAFFEVLYHSLFACQRLHVFRPRRPKTAKPCIAMLHLHAPDHDNTLLIYRVWVKQLEEKSC